MNGIALDESDLLEGPPLEGITHKVEKKKLRDERDKQAIKEKSFFNNVTDTKGEVGRPKSRRIDRPNILLCSPKQATWSRRMMARLHNPLRKEISDIYTMLEVLFHEPKAVRSYHCNLFFARWDHLCSYLTAEFEGEQQIFFRELIQADKELPEDLSSSRIKSYADLVQGIVNAMGEAERGVQNRPPIEPLQKAVKALEDIGIILEYMDDIERLIPPLLEQIADEEAGLKLEKKMILFMNKNGDYPQFNVLMMLNKLDKEEGKWLTNHACSMGVRIRIANYRTRFKVLHVRPLKEIVASLGGEMFEEYSEQTKKSALVSPQSVIEKKQIVSKEES
eukprot:CAMPEP_0184683140 /NCGR_PEP_ID=MMETSP0312-20130426/9991_1 /TAXON_ID=31354 /ORGANISM="Compsopogon coeruleus, Strain SAG 36.94" /LENGTH=334 /DNA_ID=CAMNT_0027135235 /DNA_START=161 /DNA_END=1165 /DNA_ORIENTATION=+